MRMLGRAAHRSVLVGSPSARRHCRCQDCSVEKTRRAQRAIERRLWMRDAA